MLTSPASSRETAPCTEQQVPVGPSDASSNQTILRHAVVAKIRIEGLGKLGSYRQDPWLDPVLGEVSSELIGSNTPDLRIGWEVIGHDQNAHFPPGGTEQFLQGPREDQRCQSVSHAVASGFSGSV